MRAIGWIGAAVILAMGLRPAGAMPPELPGPEERQKVDGALPARAPAVPLKPRKLLIYDVNVIYGGHGSISTANYAFQQMGQKTGAFEAVISRDPAVFQRESLKQYDAIFFNNNVGNLFTDPVLRQNVTEFVTGGGGLMGVHGTTVGFTRWDAGAADDWPEFGCMLGARGANHTTQDEKVLVKVEDPTHPVCQAFEGKDFEFSDEFFRFGEPYSRNRVHVLLSIDNAASAKLQGKELPAIRKDGDYALAWVRNYGKGRVFYSALAHSPHDFWDPKLLRFYLAGAQFILGDLPAPTVPSAKLTPAIQAEEKLGWRLGVEAYTFHKFTLFEAIDKTAQLGLPYMGGLSFQKVSDTIPKNFEPSLSDEELKQIRLKLDAAGIRMLTYYIQDIPGDEAAARRIFDFGRKMGIETFMAEPAPAALDLIGRLCDEYGINVALHNHDKKGSPLYWRPEGILEACKGKSKRIGAAADLGYWMRSGIDPVEGVRKLGDRLITFQMHDLNEITPEGHDVPWGTGAGKTEAFLKEVHRLGIRPTMFGLEYSYNWLESMPEIAKTIEFFNKVSVDLAR